MLAFYGDDFTGSTDALEFISRAGARAVLFVEPPTKEQLAQFPDMDVIGVAGKTRSLSPEKMERVLIPAFEQLKSLGAKHVHYKVCSTFDSSPATGSIGRAVDCGAAVFENRPIPVLGGMPALGRFCVFGNLFARLGIGSNGHIHRLDRHPSMSKHPVTPADESDLRVHLGKQTSRKIALIDIVRLDSPIEDWKDVENEEVVLIDALYDQQLSKIGQWLMEQQRKHGVCFSVGSSGIERALGNRWNEMGQLRPVTTWPDLQKANPLLVVSGSCSPVSIEQIEWGKANGFEDVIIDAVKISMGETIDITVLDRVASFLLQNKNVIVHTGLKKPATLSAQKLGSALGKIAKYAAMNSNVKRVVVSGGDTSSYAARAMEISAVEMIAPLVVGAPLCRAFSENGKINGLEVNFKGGQVGASDYFGVLLNGRQLDYQFIEES